MNRMAEPIMTISQTILQESNPEILKKWHKLAAKVDSVEEFITKKD